MADQQQHRQVGFINPNNVFTDAEQWADLDLGNIEPTFQYLKDNESSNKGAGRVTCAIGNERNIPPEMQPIGTFTGFMFLCNGVCTSINCYTDIAILESRWLLQDKGIESRF